MPEGDPQSFWSGFQGGHSFAEGIFEGFVLPPRLFADQSHLDNARGIIILIVKLEK